MTSVVQALLAVVGSAVMFATPVYFILQVWAVKRLQRGWRIAALLPLIAAIPLIVWCAFAYVAKSNLWPVPFLLFAPFGTAYLGFVLILHRWRVRYAP